VEEQQELPELPARYLGEKISGLQKMNVQAVWFCGRKFWEAISACGPSCYLLNPE